MNFLCANKIAPDGTPPAGKGGNNRAKAQGNYFSSVLSVLGDDGVLTLTCLPQGNFLLRRAGKKQSFDLKFIPWGWGSTQGTES